MLGFGVAGNVRARPGGFDVANILIVDDDPAVQLTIRLLLERAGHHVTAAGDGRKGLRRNSMPAPAADDGTIDVA